MSWRLSLDTFLLQVQQRVAVEVLERWGTVANTGDRA
jgi:hypothetical protein